jgi:DNA-binding MurR/RpiR family transcriptional regulator
MGLGNIPRRASPTPGVAPGSSALGRCRAPVWRRAVSPQLGTPSERFDRNVQRRSASVLKQRVLEQQRGDFLAALASAANEDAIERATASIVSARRRFVLGTGKSYSFASLLATDLSAGLSGVTLLDGGGSSVLDTLTDIRGGDILIAISLSRYRKETVDRAQSYVKRGGSLILITDADSAPLASLATERIVIGADSASFANSPTSVVLALHLLATLSISSSKGAGRRLRERDLLASELGLYHQDAPS